MDSPLYLQAHPINAEVKEEGGRSGRREE